MTAEGEKGGRPLARLAFEIVAELAALLFERAPSFAALGSRAADGDHRAACCRQGRSGGGKDFKVRTERFVRLPRRYFLGNYSNACDTTDGSEACWADFDVNPIFE